MGKLIYVDEETKRILDEIRRERNCSYSKAIALLAVEKDRQDRNLAQITDYFEFFKKIMPNIEHELEILRIIVVWLYKASYKDRKETAERVREDIEKIMSIVVEEAKEGTKSE